MTFAGAITRLNAACTRHIATVQANFRNGGPIACIWRQAETDIGRIRPLAREWWLEAPWSDLIVANPKKDEIVEINGIDYAIARIENYRSEDGWTRIVVRPVR